MNITNLIKTASLAAALVGSAHAATFYFNGGAGEASSYGNSLSFGPVSGVSVTATAWAYGTFAGFGSSPTFTTAGLTQWSGGLGVSNRNEGLSPGSPNHSTDNSSTIDYLKFTFSSAVNLSQLSFGWVDGDSDFKYWVGNNLTTANLSSGGTTVNGGGSAGSYNISGTGNTLWVAASPTGGNNDYFKLKTVTFTTPPPPTQGVPDHGSTVAFLGLALLGLAGLKRRMAA